MVWASDVKPENMGGITVKIITEIIVVWRSRIEPTKIIVVIVATIIDSKGAVVRWSRCKYGCNKEKKKHWKTKDIWENRNL